MNIYQYTPFCILSYTDKTNLNNNIQYKPGMVILHPVNQFVMTSAITEPEPSPRPSSSLWVKKIGMSIWDTPRNIFYITPEDKYQYKFTLIQLMQHEQVKNQ